MQQQVCIKACELILLIQSSFSHYSWKFYSSYNSPIINLSFQLSKMFKLVSFLVLQHSSVYTTFGYTMWIISSVNFNLRIKKKI